MLLSFKGDKPLCLLETCVAVADVDADGLAVWTACPHGWRSGDAVMQMLAIALSMEGFSLPDFDAWLQRLPPCKARPGLIRARAELVAAILGRKEWMQILVSLHAARWRIEQEVFARPRIERDAKRQAGTHMERRPDVTRWIDGQLIADAFAKSPDLWARAPEWLTEQIGFDRFRKRVTERRKMRRK